MTLIGLMGKKRSGKDTFASTLVNNGYTRFAFADPMKDALLAVNPWVAVASKNDDGGFVASSTRLANLIRHVGWEGAKEMPEVRRLLQDFGMSIRDIDPDFWIRATMEPAADLHFEGWPVVISDARFKNEIAAIREAGGTLIRIDRPGLTSDDKHVSENDWTDVEPDLVVVNDGSLADLEAKALDLIG